SGATTTAWDSLSKNIRPTGLPGHQRVVGVAAPLKILPTVPPNQATWCCTYLPPTTEPWNPAMQNAFLQLRIATSELDAIPFDCHCALAFSASHSRSCSRRDRREGGD